MDLNKDHSESEQVAV